MPTGKLVIDLDLVKTSDNSQRILYELELFIVKLTHLQKDGKIIYGIVHHYDTIVGHIKDE